MSLFRFLLDIISMHQREDPVNTLYVLFCGFTKVPDASKITRFKQDFLDDLQIIYPFCFHYTVNNIAVLL